MKNLTGGIASLLAFFAPVQPLVGCALAFIGIDFATGVAASYKRARRSGGPWAFESRKAWRTVGKLVLVSVGILMTWTIDHAVFPFVTLNLANLFTGFVCGVELWSYLGNAAEITEYPLFRGLQKYMRQKMDNQLKNDTL